MHRQHNVPLLPYSFTPAGEEGRGDIGGDEGDTAAAEPLDKLGGGDPRRPKAQGLTSLPSLDSSISTLARAYSRGQVLR